MADEVITVSAVDTAIDSQVTTLQSIVDTAESASAALRTQRAALQAQINALDKQIADAEGQDAPKARRAITVLNSLKVSSVPPVRQFPPNLAARMAALQPK